MLVKIDLVHGHFKKQKTKQKRGGEDLVDPTNTGWQLQSVGENLYSFFFFVLSIPITYLQLNSFEIWDLGAHRKEKYYKLHITNYKKRKKSL